MIGISKLRNQCVTHAMRIELSINDRKTVTLYRVTKCRKGRLTIQRMQSVGDPASLEELYSGGKRRPMFPASPTSPSRFRRQIVGCLEKICKLTHRIKCESTEKKTDLINIVIKLLQRLQRRVSWISHPSQPL